GQRTRTYGPIFPLLRLWERARLLPKSAQRFGLWADEREVAVEQIKLSVPTYYGSAHDGSGTLAGLPEFGEPNVPVLIHEAEGVRIVLGTHDFNDRYKPDVQIERRPNGWVIFLHPDDGDAAGFVHFLDDGRSYLTIERGPSAIEVLDPPLDLL